MRRIMVIVVCWAWGLSGLAAGAAEEYDLRLHTRPNPFKAGYTDARLVYYLPDAGDITIIVYDRDGNLVRTVGENLRRPGGSHRGKDSWDGRDDDGELVTPGLYVIVLEVKIAGDVIRDTFNCVVKR
jgi:hypothetical protein